MPLARLTLSLVVLLLRLSFGLARLDGRLVGTPEPAFAGLLREGGGAPSGGASLLSGMLSCPGSVFSESRDLL